MKQSEAPLVLVMPVFLQLPMMMMMTMMWIRVPLAKELYTHLLGSLSVRLLAIPVTICAQAWRSRCRIWFE